MQFNDTTNKNGIIQQIEFALGFNDAGITGNPTLFKQITAIVNNLYMRATGVIISADGNWNWDDSNQDDRPTATANLVSGQSDYQVFSAAPTTSQDWLEVIEVNVANSGGDFYRLKHRNKKYFSQPKTERDKTSGQPLSFYFNGVSIFLDAEPDYSYTNGLEIQFNRAPLLFTVADTTKRPGFSSHLHEYFVTGVKQWWLKNKVKDYGGSDRAKNEMLEMEKEMQKFYGNRNKFEVNRISRPPQSYK